MFKVNNKDTRKTSAGLLLKNLKHALTFNKSVIAKINCKRVTVEEKKAKFKLQ